jgi:hypothetical protein
MKPRETKQEARTRHNCELFGFAPKEQRARDERERLEQLQRDTVRLIAAIRSTL